MPQQRTLDKAAPKKPTGAAGYRQLAEQGHLWTAPSGAVIRVRDISIIDQVQMGQLPNDLQEVVNNVLDKSESLRNTKDEADELEVVKDLAGGEDRNLRTAVQRMDALAIAFICMGWIEPQVVRTPDEVTDPETQLHAAQVLPGDREGYMGYVFGERRGEAMKLATFPGKQA